MAEQIRPNLEALEAEMEEAHSRWARPDSPKGDLLQAIAYARKLEALLLEAYDCTSPDEPGWYSLPRMLRANIALALQETEDGRTD